MRLILSCSATKRPAGTHDFIPFAQLYDGPMWRQVRASGFPLDQVGAISAQCGFLEPGQTICTYDRLMDEEMSGYFIRFSDHVWRLAQFCKGEHVVMFGGKLYRAIGEAAKRKNPAECSGLEFVTGTFLQQRKQLGITLRAAPA